MLAPTLAPAPPAATPIAPSTANPSGLIAVVNPTAWPTRLHFAPAPTDGGAMVGAELQKFVPPRARARAPLLSDPDKLDLRPPLADYSLKVSDILAGHGLDAAVQTGFKYLVDSSGKPAAIASAFLNPQTGGLSFVTVGYTGTSGDYPPALTLGNDLDQLAALASLNNGAYEVRILHLSVQPAPGDTAQTVAARQANGFWLKSDDAGNDMFYTMGNVTEQSGFQPDTLYTTNQMLDAVRAAAQPARP